MPIATLLLVMWMGGGCYEMPAGNLNYKSMTVTPEHVIEIRTKLDVREPKCKTTNVFAPPDPATCGCPPDYDFVPYHPEGCGNAMICSNDTFIPDQCVRVTKTLWIDRVRVGVIREVEDVH